jgi:hypothetical protein
MSDEPLTFGGRVVPEKPSGRGRNRVSHVLEVETGAAWSEWWRVDLRPHDRRYRGEVEATFLSPDVRVRVAASSPREALLALEDKMLSLGTIVAGGAMSARELP